MLVLFALAATLLLAFVVLAFFLRTARAGTGYSRPLDCHSDWFTDTTDMSLNDFVGGVVTGSMVGMPGDVVPRQAEADQPAALGGYEAAAQHDHGSVCDHAGGFEAGASFDAGCGFDAGSSFDCGTGGGF